MRGKVGDVGPEGKKKELPKKRERNFGPFRRKARMWLGQRARTSRLTRAQGSKQRKGGKEKNHWPQKQITAQKW